VNRIRAIHALMLPLFAATVLFGITVQANAYAVLSHEEVVDMAWPQYLLPLLRQRYPGLTAAQIKECHAYAYGGSLIQDIGYYPFGDKEFSDLLHYVRSGDFVDALLRDASTPDELAFALGALSHYYGDTVGHITVNLVTGEEYPSLRHRFGRIVTYGDDQTAHLRTEFGFDVVEVAHSHYSQEDYRNFIGFQVAEPLLNRAFEETYGLRIDVVLTDEDLAIASYRYSVSTLIPRMTKVALLSYHEQIENAAPGFDKRKFLYRMRRTEFEQTYGRQRFHASFGQHLLAGLLHIVPKVGPFRALRLHLPNADQQTEYLASVNTTVDTYEAELKLLKATPVNSPPPLLEVDFDTGNITSEGEYKLADQTYGWLVEQLAEDATVSVSPALLADINHFYSSRSAPDALQRKHHTWERLQEELAALRQTQDLSK
jgi:hypothetical protein